MTELRIRNLTPKEYWRLQGFSDEDYQKAKDTGISNTQLYKQAGNSICVPVIQGILKNLVANKEVVMEQQKVEEVKEVKEDLVNKPQHYELEDVTVTIKTIQYLEMFPYLIGTALAYLIRRKHKDSELLDLKKAEWFFKRTLATAQYKNLWICPDDKRYIAEAFYSKDFAQYLESPFAITTDDIERLKEKTRFEINRLEGKE